LITQRDQLIDRLGSHGWRATKLDEQLDWWADEMWQLESNWSPRDARAYLTFLVDPMTGLERKPHEDVWAAAATPHKPIKQQDVRTGLTLSLGHGWNDRVQELIEYLNKLRQVEERNDR
jgi:hypothetical protein